MFAGHLSHRPHFITSSCTALKAGLNPVLFLLLQSERLLTAVVSQGMPTIPTFVVADQGEKNVKKLNDGKKSLLKVLEKKFPDIERLYSVTNSQVQWESKYWRLLKNLLVARKNSKFRLLVRDRDRIEPEGRGKNQLSGNIHKNREDGQNALPPCL